MPRSAYERHEIETLGFDDPRRLFWGRVCGFYVLWSIAYGPLGVLWLFAGLPLPFLPVLAFVCWLPFDILTGALALIYIFWPVWKHQRTRVVYSYRVGF